MKKILIVSGSLKTGGLEKVAVNCMKYANRYRLQFYFLVFDTSIGEYEHMVTTLGGKIIRITCSSNPIKYYLTIKNVIKEYGPFDIVHSHVFFNSAIVLLAAKKCGVRQRIAHSHSIQRADTSWIKKLIYKVMRIMLNVTATQKCACSTQAGIYLFGPSFLRNGMIIPNIIDADKFVFNENERLRIRCALKILPNEIVLGQVGHLAKAKNQLFLLDLFHDLLGDIDAKLVIVGDGTMRDTLKMKILEYNMADKVILTGNRDDVPALLSAMDLYLCTSTNEGFGIVILEALANGLRCVAECNAIVDEVKSLGNMILVDGFKNKKNWKQEILKALQLQYNRMEGNALIKNSNYTKEHLIAVLQTLYSKPC